MQRIRFGPSGNADAFYEQGHKSTWEAPKWLHEMGLDAFEYSFGHGVRIKRDTAAKIGEEAAKYGLAVSAHAPYYINLVDGSDTGRRKNIKHLLGAVRAGSWMGAVRVVVHPGSASGVDRDEGLAIAKESLQEIMAELDAEGFGGIRLCIETMGKKSQLGTVEEIMALCALDQRLLPTLDFGHIDARGGGSLKTPEDFAAVLDAVERALGADRLHATHIHFSRIEHTAAGEKRHWTFADTQYGPDFGPLALELARRKLAPVVICESKGTMAEDALQMKQIYEAAVRLLESEGKA
jgi:deoxyribonuclease-4